MKIVDAQVHIWRQTVVPTTGKHRKVAKVTAEEMLKEMDEAGVDAALIHPPMSWDPTSQDMALEAAKKYPDRFAIMGQFDPKVPANKALIPTWRKQPGMMGLRWALLQPKEQELLHEGALDWIWPEAEKAGLAVAMMGGIFLKQFRSIAERYPGLKLILDHCGLNRLGQDAEAFIHLDEMTALAKLPNVAVKMTGAPHYSTQPYPVQEHPGRAASHLRRLRARPPVLGHRYHPHALHLPPVRHLLHRGAAMAERPGPREGHGPQPLQVGRLELQVLGRS